MNEVSLQLWGKFTLESLFNIVKGTRLTKKDMIEGDINYVGASAFNNGVTAHIGNTDNIHPGGLLTVCYNGSIGQTFYQESRFWATDDVNVLYPKFNMTKYMALFIAPLIKIVGRNYQYTDKWQIEDMKRSVIYLPIKSDNCPNWGYMDIYMRKLHSKAKRSLDILQSVVTPPNRQGMNIKSWKFFVVGDLFDIHPTRAYKLINSKLLNGGSNPVVVNSAFSNGIGGYTSLENLEKGNILTFSDTVDANTIFYQEYKFRSICGQ